MTVKPSNRAGSCQARVMPRFALPEMDRAVMSSPWKTTFPDVGENPDRPMTTEARVDLPVPFIPRIAWISPGRTCRLRS